MTVICTLLEKVNAAGTQAIGSEPVWTAQVRRRAACRARRSGMSQADLAKLVHVQSDLIAKVDKAAPWPTEALATSCDSALATPWNRLVGVRDELVWATRNMLGGASNTGWRPHVSIAYNARPRAATPILDRVRELRRQPPIEVTVTDIELVKLARTGRVYRWTTVHRLTLAGRPDPR